MAMPKPRNTHQSCLPGLGTGMFGLIRNELLLLGLLIVRAPAKPQRAQFEAAPSGPRQPSRATRRRSNRHCRASRRWLPPPSSSSTSSSACLLRFRPILMTAAAALLAGLPMMFGHGTGPELRRPLGCSMLGGLALSQLPALYTTPGGLFLPRPPAGPGCKASKPTAPRLGEPTSNECRRTNWSDERHA
jgi:hypothetical protein